MPRIKYIVYVVLLSAACLSAAFLGWWGLSWVKPTYQVSGKITRDGKALEWKSDAGVLDVKFVPLDRQADDNVYRAETDRETGAYTIPKIPAGSYRVSIQQMDPFPTHDLLGFALSMAESPIIREVTMNDDVIDIDLPLVLSKKGK
jgi:hypothetical protein